MRPTIDDRPWSYLMPDPKRQEFVQALPFARRFARALSGDQKQGDVLVAESLKAAFITPDDDLPARYRLYREIAGQFSASSQEIAQEGLSFSQRALLLLTSLEEVPISVAAAILDMNQQNAIADIQMAHDGLRRVAATSVLIIEDEPIIAMDIQDVAEQCGHRIVGVAHNEADAVRIAEETKPGLILADINLGGGGDGMLAVGRILKTHRTPVIFVTAYPERLLTGETEEPSFVITKPFEPVTLAITTYQAVTGGMKAF